MSASLAGLRPGFVPWAFRTTLRIDGRSRRDTEFDLGERILESVRIARRITAVILQSPTQNALLPEIRILQMLNPGKKGDVSLDDCAEAFGGIGFVTRNFREELRDETRVVKLLFLVSTEISFGAGHPKEIALQNDLLMVQTRPVRVSEPFLSEREKAIDFYSSALHHQKVILQCNLL